MNDRASEVLAEGFLPGESRTYDARSKRSGVPFSTFHHPLEKYLKGISDLGNLVRIKFGFVRRHSVLKLRRVRAIDWKRYENNIYDKIIHWFDIIGNILQDPAILPEN
ncbi:hypothetical protein DL98DRAFT_521563, partial [Cadophora sp. DSE1049]